MNSISEKTAATLATYLKGQPKTPELIQLIQRLIYVNPKYSQLLSIFVDESSTK